VASASHPEFSLETGLRIKAEATSLGFRLCAITRPAPPYHFDIFKGWLNREFHAGMAYLSSERSLHFRANPAHLFPECRSILVLAAAYPEIKPAHDPALGIIASYALAKDYHLTLVEALKELHQHITAIIGRPFLSAAYTDSAPILERDLAWQSGMGWIGKNANLISPRIGSFFLLAELFTDLDLEPDPPPVGGHCGTCERCLQACPTACILPDRTIDSRRCISYLTIENKGSIPAPLRPLIGRRIFGCDICQAVCPWNTRHRDALTGGLLEARSDLANPALIEAMALSETGFKMKYRGTPIMRSKRSGFLRNVCVALGNSGDEQALPALSTALERDPEVLIRSHAAWALGQFSSKQARDALKAALLTEPDPGVKEEILAAVSARG